jgi:hypothetical protein
MVFAGPGTTGGILLAVFNIIESGTYAVGKPHIDNYENCVSSLCSVLNGAAVTLLTLPTFIAPELLPSWIEGPIVMFLLTAGTSLQLALSYLNSVKGFFVALSSVCAHLASSLQCCGAMKIFARIKAVLVANINSVVVSLSTTCMEKAKIRAENALLDEYNADLDEVNSNGKFNCLMFLNVHPKVVVMWKLTRPAIKQGRESRDCVLGKTLNRNRFQQMDVRSVLPVS